MVLLKLEISGPAFLVFQKNVVLNAELDLGSSVQHFFLSLIFMDGLASESQVLLITYEASLFQAVIKKWEDWNESLYVFFSRLQDLFPFFSMSSFQALDLVLREASQVFEVFLVEILLLVSHERVYIMSVVRIFFIFESTCP